MFSYLSKEINEYQNFLLLDSVENSIQFEEKMKNSDPKSFVEEYLNTSNSNINLIQKIIACLTILCNFRFEPKLSREEEI